MIKIVVTLVLIAFLSISSDADRLDLSDATFRKLAGEHIYDIEFEFDNMEIHSLAPDTFNAAKKTVQKIDLSYNKFTSLPYNVFSGLEKIKKIDVGHNNLESIDRRTFNGLSTLEEIKLKSCSLKSIEPGTFDGLSNLNSLDISLNYLTNLDANLFSSLRSLSELELRYNKIESLNANVFANTRKLKELSLDNNQLSTLDVDNLNKLCFKRLSVDNNRQLFNVKKVDKCMIVSKVIDGNRHTTKSAGKKNAASNSQTNSATCVLAILGVIALF